MDGTSLPEVALAPRSGRRKALLRPATTQSLRVNWSYAIGVVVVHLLALLAFVPWLFSWTGVAMVFVGNYLFCSLGIGAGFHRCLTHRSFRCPKWFEHLLTILGVCTLQDSPARWVAIHRVHHQHPDEDTDPHSPLASFFWGHMGWLFIVNSQFQSVPTYEKYVRDLLRDPFQKALVRNELWSFVYAAHALVILLLGFLAGWLWAGTLSGGVQFGLSMLVWGVFVRTVYSWHVTWGTNSVSHYWGYRNYETGENSRNNWLIGITSGGDGWHNNHHADPRCCAHGFHRWWELDTTYLTILLWERIGLVWSVRRRGGRVTVAAAK
jgi:fatty-acid desaturase